MPRDPAVFILSVLGVDGIEEKKRQIAKIGGVSKVEHNVITQKLLVTYEGEDDGSALGIERELNSILHSGRGGGKPPKA